MGAGFDVVVQYFSSRGFALAAVDYAGSTGYGRDYRCSLWGQWGILDSEDCVDAARYLAAEQWVDGTRMAVRGTSSGGLTALNALADGGAFAAAASWYGVSDLCALAASTHDFEAHYLDRLVGPLPEYREAYEARSPVGRAEEINGAVLLLQGLDDRVVPPAQTERLRRCAAGPRPPLHGPFLRGGGARVPAGRDARGVPGRGVGVLPASAASLIRPDQRAEKVSEMLWLTWVRYVRLVGLPCQPTLAGFPLCEVSESGP